ncbi:unnamed protein product [Didymodactylos carnosus]|uniref:Uncharacterized protein n=1 Tax=Didymodactylos carnosus TaxID=1234261 RepID=A0A814KBK9_9BILA|nr:unnamed protein product [Didymodactylos carnosus]CAF1105119.1 unnamed protein product [Didymodactylos carnosus]CAF3816962.1 unnamed protein product [Didymodactylos carnosus]CAF3868419.1 unnamed protein product [Didymodactylos carnosus]
MIYSPEYTTNIDQQHQQQLQQIIYEDDQQSLQYLEQPQAHIDSSQPLAKCSVLYLGTALSSPGQRGIDAVQEPLSRRYPVDGTDTVRGIEAWLSVYENGLQLQFACDPSVVLFYPIRSLVYCASIRFATRTQTGAQFPSGWRFVPLDSPAAARVENTQNPPLYCSIFRRTRHLPVDECHCFVTKTRQAALALVQACFSAYQATSTQQDCSKVPLYFKVDDYGSKNKEIDSEIRIVPSPDRERTLDYQTNTEGPGFFYKTDRVPIDSWQLWEHHKHDLDQDISSKCSTCSSSRSRSSSSSSSCSSCYHRRARHHHRKKHRRRHLASIPPTPRGRTPTALLHQPHSETSTAATITLPTNAPPIVDPYAPAPNLVKVEKIKDVNSGKDVFIRWIHDETKKEQPSMTTVPQQAYSTKPPDGQQLQLRPYSQPSFRTRGKESPTPVPSDIQHIARIDEHLRKSLQLDDRDIEPRRQTLRSDLIDIVDYEVISGYFEDKYGKKRAVKVNKQQHDHAPIRDYKSLYGDEPITNPTGYIKVKKRRRPQQQAPQQQYVQPLPNSQFLQHNPMRPYTPAFLPRSTFPAQTLTTASLMSRPTMWGQTPIPWQQPLQHIPTMHATTGRIGQQLTSPFWR